MLVKKLCLACGHISRPKTFTRGSLILEIALWLLILLPGLLYSLWRLTNRFQGCPQCEAKGMIPLDSPVARSFLEQHKVSTSSSSSKEIEAPPEYVSSTPKAAQARYRIARDGKDLGVYSIATIRNLLEDKHLSIEDFYLDEQTNNWMPLYSNPDLF